MNCLHNRIFFGKYTPVLRHQIPQFAQAARKRVSWSVATRIRNPSALTTIVSDSAYANDEKISSSSRAGKAFPGECLVAAFLRLTQAGFQVAIMMAQARTGSTP